MMTACRRAALLALAILATACSADQAPTAAPAELPSPRPNFSLTAAEQEQLQQTLEQEIARVDAEEDLNAVLYSTLKPVWRTASPLTGLLGLPLLACEPLPYDSDVQIVGPAGGVLSVGPHKLTIPAGALREHTVITAEAPVGLSRTVKFSPHGLRFDRPTKLNMSYDRCRTSWGTRPTLVYVDEQLNILEWVNSRVLGGGLVQGDVWHFSRYAVGRRSSYATSW